MTNTTIPVGPAEGSEIKWEKLAQISLDMICTLNADGVYTYVSEASADMLGYESKELIGRHFTEVLHPEDLDRTHRAIQVASSGLKEGNFENQLLHKNGKTVPILWSAAWSEEEGLLYCVARDITELQVGRRRVEESEQRYKALFQNNPDVVFLENHEGMVTEVNDSFCQLWGLTSEEALSRSGSSFMPPDLVSIAEAALRDVLQGHTVRRTVELCIQNQRRVFDTIKYPVYVNGEVIGAQTICKDITETVLAHETIQRQAQKLNAILESITDAFMTISRDWTITYLNKEAQRLLPFSGNQDLGVNIWDLFPEEVGGDSYIHYHRAFETGKTVTFTTYLKGHGKWFQVKAYPSEEGLSIYFDDVTDKVQAQQELEKLSLVASKSNNGVLIIDRNGIIEWVNEGFTRLHGYHLEEAIGKRPSELLHHPKADQSIYKPIEEKLHKGESLSFEVLNRKKDGEGLWVSVEISPVFDGNNALARFVVVQTDISALKNSELELAQLANDLYKQKSDLQQFSYIISHNLRGPVANALGLVDLLLDMQNHSEMFQKSIQFLRQSILKLDAVLKDVNTILGIRDSKGNLELEQVNVPDVIDQALSSFKEPLAHSGATVAVDLNEDLSVKANKAYLYSIFYNLLSNSLKYRSDERKLEIKIKCLEYSENGVTLSFTDNGLGFDLGKAKENVFKLYKRFHTKQEGRGMGLFLIKSHLDAMGGHVEVNSRVGEGTSFLLYLPH
ncbi:PAS domain-containing sensor histidine kinase [Rufibacter latericius]|uniref:histidine kinase n=1 Tax=Rufibacter latericius TaxID=2487040 RepID=A0A3M9N0Z5_9BACT|nr:PAS domain S-box protein [Rufibacter latericius]RNI31440.1 PAS domain S-box protein [Rufibacter latericius]